MQKYIKKKHNTVETCLKTTLLRRPTSLRRPPFYSPILSYFNVIQSHLGDHLTIKTTLSSPKGGICSEILLYIGDFYVWYILHVSLFFV